MISDTIHMRIDMHRHCTSGWPNSIARDSPVVPQQCITFCTFQPPNHRIPQSISIPLLLRSLFASAISPISSLCASGTSLKVNTPHPSLNSKYAPNETIAQNGNYRSIVREQIEGRRDRGACHWYYLILHDLCERYDV